MNGTRSTGWRLWVAIFGLLLLAGGAGILLAGPRRALDFGDVTPAGSQTSQTAMVAAVAGGKTPQPEVGGRLRVPITDRDPTRLPADGVPSGWTLKEFVGEPSIELVRADGRVAVRLRSERASFAIHRDVVVQLRELPYLSWSWKVTKLPAGGDVREVGRDDQAAQLYVIFPRWPAPRTMSDVIGYVWDSRAPVGTSIHHPRADNVRIIVVESGASRLNEWRTYERNVADDYTALFGRQPPRVGKVALMIDSNDTRESAEALFGELTFSRTSQGRTEIPAFVLR